MVNIKDKAQNTGNTSNEGLVGRENFKNYDVVINSLEKDIETLKEKVNTAQQDIKDAKIDTIKSDLSRLEDSYKFIRNFLVVTGITVVLGCAGYVLKIILLPIR